MLDEVKDNSILIVPNSLKGFAIGELSKRFISVKVISFDEFIRKFLFDFDDRAIFFLMKKFNIKYDIALDYILNIYFINDCCYDNSKLDKLVSIKRDLKCNGLLIYDDLFRKFLCGKCVYVYYDVISKFQGKVLDEVRSICDVCLIKPAIGSYVPIIHEFGSINDEVVFVANSICDLIFNGVSINNIKLVNVGDDYISEVRRIFGFFNIPININKKNIFGTRIVQDFISRYDSDISCVLEYLCSSYDMSGENGLIFNKIVGVVNDFVWCRDFLDVKDLIVSRLRNSCIDSRLDNAVDIVSLDEVNDQYVFVLGFNQGSIPVVFKDEEYIDDASRVMLGLDTSIDKNIMEKERVINRIHSIRNCIISYKLKSPFSSFYPSSIIGDLGGSVVSCHDFSSISYSSLNDRVNLTCKIDNLLKYNVRDDVLSVLYSNYSIPYNSYSNKFTGINNDSLLEFIDNKVLLSYSSLDGYFHCGFRYYINNILRLNPFQQSFYTVVGSLFHHVLEKCLSNGDDYKGYWDSYVSGLSLSSKERFFIDNLEETCRFTVDTIKEQMKFCSLDSACYEKKIFIDKSGSTKVTFMGVIDKLLYKEDVDKTIVAVIDYKTGNTSIDLNKCFYGLSLQLPVYLYLAKNSGLTNVKFAGFYLQNIINADKDVSSLRLNGFSSSDKGILSIFDSSYENSSVIKGMRTKSDGDFYSYAKTLNDSQINSLINLVDSKISEASNDVLSGKFDINPKKIDGVNVGCEFCTFKDICFKREQDSVYLKGMDYKDFLGEF